MTTIIEADVEQAALDWQVAHGPDIAPDKPNAERDDYGQVVLERRLRDSLVELNPGLPASTLDDAYRKLTRPQGSTLEARNRAFHRMLVSGVEIEYRDSDGRVRGDQIRVLGACPRIRSWRRKPPRNNLLTAIWTLSWSK